ncbi:hydroxymethylglutaryl-CoA lyase [Psychrobacillus psychrodurans]|uniref:hydroxymethylglutaryl-CoA lyase n=1 Tax=Psychrobacillus psychrodurans TaxID=126157 RepID=UPI0008EDE974|nr:hydroxymethylglutaryl-CoA lyase [Psychrobacillus psychrodurans]MCZ8538811.1 hydroxymethylglutaryl-CoA lyase [Psychrobacillus psychrodurans]SFM22424.1 hydroxymethylglutaryl-CoA lyase [Psychrobacillus psychrodurans]
MVVPSFPEKVYIREVGPRDGLQNESKFIQTDDKIQWIDHLSNTGLNYIEVTSFVNPTWIPALSDADYVAKHIKKNPDVTYAALIPNIKGLSRALESSIDEVAVFISASESHNKNNINKTISETEIVLSEVVKESISNKKTVRGYISTVFGCPFEGHIEIDQVIRLADSLFEMGINELSLGDTIGIANPSQVKKVLEKVLKRYSPESIAMHFHNTRGTALANVLASLEMGISKFDSSLGGLGGCPYAPGASGNLATDDLNYMLTNMGIVTNINPVELNRAALFIQEKLQKPLDSYSVKYYESQH